MDAVFITAGFAFTTTDDIFAVVVVVVVVVGADVDADADVSADTPFKIDVVDGVPAFAVTVGVDVDVADVACTCDFDCTRICVFPTCCIVALLSPFLFPFPFPFPSPVLEPFELCFVD